MLQCSFLHCLSICKLSVVFFCTVCPYVNCLLFFWTVCPYVNCLLFFCTVWSTLIRISLTKALVLWWCDNKSDLIWFEIFSCLSLLSNISLDALIMPWMRRFTSHNLPKLFTAIFTLVFCSMILFSPHIEVAEPTHNIHHNQTLYDWFTGTPMILNFRQAPPYDKVNACQLCPSRLCLRSKAKQQSLVLPV